jgi:hypothetical protein
MTYSHLVTPADLEQDHGDHLDVWHVYTTFYVRHDTVCSKKCDWQDRCDAAGLHIAYINIFTKLRTRVFPFVDTDGSNLMLIPYVLFGCSLVHCKWSHTSCSAVRLSIANGPIRLVRLFACPFHVVSHVLFGYSLVHFKCSHTSCSAVCMSISSGPRTSCSAVHLSIEACLHNTCASLSNTKH